MKKPEYLPDYPWKQMGRDSLSPLPHEFPRISWSPLPYGKYMEMNVYQTAQMCEKLNLPHIHLQAISSQNDDELHVQGNISTGGAMAITRVATTERRRKKINSSRSGENGQVILLDTDAAQKYAARGLPDREQDPQFIQKYAELIDSSVRSELAAVAISTFEAFLENNPTFLEAEKNDLRGAFYSCAVGLTISALVTFSLDAEHFDSATFLSLNLTLFLFLFFAFHIVIKTTRKSSYNAGEYWDEEYNEYLTEKGNISVDHLIPYLHIKRAFLPITSKIQTRGTLIRKIQPRE